MALFYLTATASDGQRATKAVGAKSLAEAKKKLEDRGWTDIVVNSDDGMAVNQIEIPGNVCSPDEMVRLGRMSPLQYFFWMLRKNLVQNFTLALFGAICLGLGVMRQDWYAVALGVGGLLLPIGLAFWAAYGNTGKRRYDAVVTAACWYRWDDVERLLPTLPDQFPPEELAFRTAQIPAGRGDIKLAIRRYNKGIAAHDVPEWYADSRRATFYLTAGKVEWLAQANEGKKRGFESPLIDEAIRCYEHSIELDPEQGVTIIDMAKVVVKYQRDVRLARKLLSVSKKLDTVDIGLMFADYVEGMIAVEEKSPEKAIRLISEFQSKLTQAAANPTVDAVIDEARAYLTLAYALGGQEEQAMKQFRLCEPRMIATNELEILARCRDALGLKERSKATARNE